MCEFAPSSPWKTIFFLAIRISPYTSFRGASKASEPRIHTPVLRSMDSGPGPSGRPGMTVDVSRACAPSSTRQHGPRFLQVLRRVDAARHRVDDGDVDAHAGVERAQLLQPLALLVRRRRQLDEALERGAPVRIEADVVIVRAGPLGVGA